MFNQYKDDLSFLGPEIEKETAHLIAICEINPDTREKYSDILARQKIKQGH